MPLAGCIIGIGERIIVIDLLTSPIEARRLPPLPIGEISPMFSLSLLLSLSPTRKVCNRSVTAWSGAIAKVVRECNSWFTVGLI